VGGFNNFYSRGWRIMMKIHYWNYVSCIQSDNLDDIELAITHLLEEEGYRRLPDPPQSPDHKILEKCIYPWQTVPNLAIVVLFVGANGWTIVKTSPMELLCRRVQGATRLGLSTLAIQLGCGAFHFSAYSGSYGIFAEVDPRGSTFVSGWAEEYLREDKFYGEPVMDQDLQFRLLKVSEEMQAAAKEKPDFEKYKRMVTELNQFIDQESQKSENGEEINFSLLGDLEDKVENFKHTFQLVDEALGKVMGSPYWNQRVMGSPYWHPQNKNIIYLAFAEQQKLEEDGARILFFQTPPNSPPEYGDVTKDET
jgi:hypothetical protein